MENLQLYIGTSGWNYDHWKGVFYPEDIPKTKWLEYYINKFQTLELNSSFYHLPKKETFEKWYNMLPNGFIFSVKASRFITHIKKLVDIEDNVKEFLQDAVNLKEKLGPILFQLPPNLGFNKERLINFFKHLPKSFKYTFEFRNAGWWNDETFDILRKNSSSFCIFELGDLVSPSVITSDFIYIRLHGPEGRYKGNYDECTLKKWSERFLEWKNKVSEIYCYFDNDEKGFAPINAIQLKNILKLDLSN